MARLAPLPIVAALALTAAAGLTIAREHGRSYIAGTAARSTAHCYGPSAGHGESRAVRQLAGSHATTAPSTAVGSRALVGSDEDAEPCGPAQEN
jgi:hypothetical protein